MQGEDNKKSGGRERQQMHGEIIIQDQRAKAAITLAMVGRVKSGFMDISLVDKNKGDNCGNFTLLCYFPSSLPCHGSNKLCIQRTFKNDRTSLLSPR